MLTKKDKSAAKAYFRDTPAIDRAYGRVTSGDLKPGPYKILPLLGWLQKVQSSDFLALSMAVISWDDKLKGSLAWGIPLTERTWGDVVRMLATMGWDGRIWPRDGGWPTGVGEEESTLQDLLNSSTVVNTLVFPPTPQGSFALDIKIMNRQEAFPLPPIVNSSVDPETYLKLSVALKSLTAEIDLVF